MTQTAGSTQLSSEPGQQSFAGVTVMLVEDDLDLQEAIVDTLELAGFTVMAKSSAEAALEALVDVHVDMLITDVNMKGMDGHQLLSSIKSNKPYLPVLLITAFASVERSVDAIKNGAVDYLVKPFEPQKLIQLVERYATSYIVDDSAPVIEDESSKRLYSVAERVANSDSTVLIAGESGTGKEVLAQFIHRQSNRSGKPFVAINCAAIPETMLESMLFGYEKGAFTGAHHSVPGKFEQANGGTLLLDEISEMDIALQAKLLRVLQEREVERLGGRKSISLDVRVIATTNRDLRSYVEQGEFREDLYYRLSVFPLHLPPLRDRSGDILPIARNLLGSHAQKMNRNAVQLSAEAERLLLANNWPGNVRELDNVLQRALILQSGTELTAADILFDMGIAHVNTAGNTAVNSNYGVGVPLEKHLSSQPTALEDNVRQTEYQTILNALEDNRGSRKLTAETLGVSPRTLRYKMAKMRELGMLEGYA